MAVAYIEYCEARRIVGTSVIAGTCYYQTSAAIGGSASTATSAVTQAMVQAATDRELVAKVQNDGVACYLAIGPTPDPTATTATAATSIRRYVGAGAEAYFLIGVGDKISVIAVS